MKLLRTVLYLHHRLERASRKSELSISQYRMLSYLIKGPRRAAELANESRIRKPSITSLINTLESKGWIRREEDPDDRRALCIEITPKGKQAMIQFEKDMQTALQDFLDADVVAEVDERITPLYDLWNERRKQQYEQWMQQNEKPKRSRS